MKSREFRENQMKRSILNKKILKITAFDYNQHIILIMHTNAKFQSIGTKSDFRIKFPPIYMNKKTSKRQDKH